MPGYPNPAAASFFPMAFFPNPEPWRRYRPISICINIGSATPNIFTANPYMPGARTYWANPYYRRAGPDFYNELGLSSHKTRKAYSNYCEKFNKVFFHIFYFSTLQYWPMALPLPAQAHKFPHVAIEVVIHFHLMEQLPHLPK